MPRIQPADSLATILQHRIDAHTNGDHQLHDVVTSDAVAELVTYYETHLAATPRLALQIAYRALERAADTGATHVTTQMVRDSLRLL